MDLIASVIPLEKLVQRVIPLANSGWLTQKAFQQRRKMLSSYLPELMPYIVSLGYSTKTRAEEITAEDYVQIAKQLQLAK